jgi:hypothetical protein
LSRPRTLLAEREFRGLTILHPHPAFLRPKNPAFQRIGSAKSDRISRRENRRWQFISRRLEYL